MEEKIYTLLLEMHGNVISLKAGMKEMKKDVSVLKEDVAQLKQDVEGLKQDMGVLKRDMEILKRDMLQKIAELGKIESKHYEMLQHSIGDSYEMLKLIDQKKVDKEYLRNVV